MHKYQTNYIGFLPAVENAIRALASQLKLWDESRRARAASRKHEAVVGDLDLRIQHDIGATDYRPSPPAPALSRQTAYSRSIEAMMKRPV